MIQQTGVFIPPSDFLVGELIAPAGTRIPFNQSAAPVGWTIDAASTFTDCYSTIRSGSGGTSGGSVNWSSWNFGGTLNCNAVALSVANMPAHTHASGDPGHAHTAASGAAFLVIPGGANYGTDNSLSNLGSSSGVTSTNAAFANASVGNNGSGTAFTPQVVAPQVKYTDFIIGVRS